MKISANGFLADQSLENATPQEIIELAIITFDRIALSFSGAEDVVLIDMAAKVVKKLGKKLSVFCLDTGRLHPETYEFIEKVRQTYAIDLEILSPDAEKLQNLVHKKGLFSFYKDGHQECCSIRKVVPLKKKLATLDAWISGQRKDQSPSTRQQIDLLEQDGIFGTDSKLMKFNPIANWSSQQVWEYIQMFDVPFNRLHQSGFTSIGCQPCTRAVLPSQHEREGRWWWEESHIKECGLHNSKIITSTAQR